MTTALLVLDMQVSLIADETPNPGEILDTVGGLVEAARGEGVPVVWVTDSRVAPDAALHPSCAPAEDELQIVKDQRNAFEGTDLEAELTVLGAERVIVCGMQSDACIHATVRAADKLGFQVVLVSDAHTTHAFESRDWRAVIAGENETLATLDNVAVLPLEDVVL
jgi:nicotinamidase-related amidase